MNSFLISVNYTTIRTVTFIKPLNHFSSSYFQSCNCLAFAPVNPPATTQTTVSNLDGPPVLAHRPAEEQQSLPNIAAGYSDGTVRMFDLNRVEMVLKMHPHAMAVTAICFSADGES